QAFIDITDNSRISEANDILKEKYPNADIINITNNEELQSVIDDISQVFMLYFAVCLLVVIIINMTVSKRIISERMAVVGTLRSLGVSQGKTTAILLLENIIYALLGSVPGIAVYLLIRPAMLTELFEVDGLLTLDFGNMSAALQLGIIAGAIALECACTLLEVLKASRTAIRDIIFMNKDTEFRFSKGKTVVGLIFLGAALIMLLIPRSFASMMVCFIGTVIGVFILFPYVTVFFSRLLEKLFDKAGMPVAKLAAAELGSKKSTISSTQLIAAASGIMVLLFVVADSMLGITMHQNYACDLIISGISEEDYLFDYIDDLEGVTETENVYCSMYVAAEFNGSADTNLYVYGFDGIKMFTGISGLPETIGEDEFWMDKALAEKHGLKIGDTVEVKLNSDLFVPRTFTLKLGGYCNSAYFDGFGKGVVLSKSRYLSAFGDMPLNILIKTDGTNDEALIDKIGKYSSSTMSQIQTIEELNLELEKESHAENQVIKLVGVFGIILTFVGVASNQLIGFESRKRECAVLLSTSIEKSRLRAMLLLETVFSSAIPLICAFPVGLFCMYPVREMLLQLELALPLTINGAELALLAVV
ncbi:MAG: FtsX-like permease family protein, partial [Oscillospiraceae bacterium]